MHAPSSDQSLEHFTRLVTRVLRSPVSVVAVLEGDQQVFRAASGLTGEADATRRTPLTHSLCRLVIGRGRPLVVRNARTDRRTAREPAVLERDVGAYAGYPLTGADGRVVGSLCAVDTGPRDWTAEELTILQDLALACSAELRHREDQAASSHALTRALLDETGAMVLVYDASSRALLLANDVVRAAADLVGLDLEAPPWTTDQVRYADNRTPVPAEAQVIPRALHGEEVSPEVHWYGAPGHERAVSIGSHLLRHPDGTAWAAVVTGHDVTDLARALQVTESFVSSVSHELRTPLAAVLGYAEVLEDELLGLGQAGVVDTATAEQALGVIRRRAHDLEARIGDLLDVTDLRRRLVLDSTDVAELVRRVAAGFAEAATARGQHLEVRVGDPLRAMVDERRVTQALENLLTNAVKYAGHGGTIQVGVTASEHDVLLTVADDGDGLTAGEAEQVFDQFWRSEAAHRTALPGLGIGLSLVREIALAHRGEVQVETAPGRGAAFTLRLPRSPTAVT